MQYEEFIAMHNVLVLQLRPSNYQHKKLVLQELVNQNHHYFKLGATGEAGAQGGKGVR